MVADLDTAGAIVQTGNGEAILRGEEREISMLATHEEITITHARYSGGQDVAGPHVHHRHTDAFYVLEGELTFRLGCEAEKVALQRGGFAAVPPGVAHSFGNAGVRPARWLTIHAHDGGFGGFMRGVRDGVGIEWDIAAVPADGGLPASAAIVSRGPAGEPIESGDRLGRLRCALPDLCAVEWQFRGSDSGLPSPPGADPSSLFFVIAGELETMFGGVRQTARAGALISAPRGMGHEVRCRGQARALGFHTPAGARSQVETPSP